MDRLGSVGPHLVAEPGDDDPGDRRGNSEERDEPGRFSGAGVGGRGERVPEQRLDRTAQQAAHDGEHRQDRHRPGHHGRRFVRGGALVAVSHEHDEEGSGHVEGRQSRRHQQRPESDGVRVGPHIDQDLVLGKEAGQREHTGQGQAADDEASGGDRHLPSEPPHFEDVVGVDGMNHAARREEQERLEEGVRGQVKERRRRSGSSDGRHHVAELADRGEGQDALDVAGHQRHRRGQKSRERTQAENPIGDLRGVRQQRRDADHQVDAGRDHRCGVDQRGHGRRTFHRVRQPDVEWELGALAHGPEKQSSDSQRQERSGETAGLGVRKQLGEDEAAARRPEEDDAEGEADVPQACRPGGLHRLA